LTSGLLPSGERLTGRLLPVKSFLIASSDPFAREPAACRLAPLANYNNHQLLGNQDMEPRDAVVLARSTEVYHAKWQLLRTIIEFGDFPNCFVPHQTFQSKGMLVIVYT
jgi:hypothetical protein